MSSCKAIVVGAGPAGLATAAALRRAQVPAVVLEQADAIGAAWRGRYDRLRLNSPRWFSTLPGASFPRGTGVFPSRDDLVQYLDRYAQDHALDVRLGVTVQRLERDGDRWRLETSSGDLHADHVVVAGGYDHKPFVPDWPGREAFERPLIHAADYRSATAYRGRDVLVVGPGSSGAEIAQDLIDGGAARVRLAIRTPPNILLRSPIGAPLASVLHRLPPRIADSVTRFVRARTIGDLAEYGLPVPEEGIFSRLRRLHAVPMIVDPDVIEAIRERRIEIVAAVQALDATGVRFADATRIEPDAVIAATGYRRGLDPVVGHLGVLDERGAPRAVEGEAAPGLRFVGYSPRPAQLRRVGREGRRTANAIGRALPRQEAREMHLRPAVRRV